MAPADRPVFVVVLDRPEMPSLLADVRHEHTMRPESTSEPRNAVGAVQTLLRDMDMRIRHQEKGYTIYG